MYKEILTPVINSIEQYSCRNAFCISEEFYTYAFFRQRIAAIVEKLHSTSYENQKVGLVINDDIDTYASIFALWLEGKCYVPLHPEWPLDRCRDICEQVELDLILDSSASTRYDGISVLATSQLESVDKELTPVIDVPEEELAYILFTSGSTGKPKGVQLMRKNIASFMDSFWQTGITINEEDRCLQAFDLSFDVSVQSYLVALVKGACVYTIPHGQVKYVYASSLIEDHKLTFGAMAPSMLRYLKPYFDELDATSLKACILTAEACPLNLMEDWFNCATNTEIYDFYGPTEATIYCTYYKLTKGGNNKSLNGIISIGKPLANVVGLILDEQGNELPTGEKGELCVAGDQVTCGYWKNEEKNNSSFFMKDGKRFYHTGDLCYKDEDGDIMYSGRLDHQAKIQGFRVELGEIEYHAREFIKKNVVCIAFDNDKALTEIAMFIESSEFNTEEMMAYMRKKMPSYMIPTKTFFVPAFPLNTNDKTDKVKLKNMIEDSKYIFRNATVSDIDFLAEVIIESKKGVSNVLGWAELFELTIEEFREYLKQMLAEEVDGCEFSVSSFIVAEYDGKPAAAIGGWVEGGNEDGTPSSILKSNLLGFVIPMDNRLKAITNHEIVSALKVEREMGAYQMEYGYALPEHRGHHLLRRLFEQHEKRALESPLKPKKIQGMAFGNNKLSIKSLTDRGFSIAKIFESDHPDILKFVPYNKLLLFEKQL